MGRLKIIAENKMTKVGYKNNISRSNPAEINFNPVKSRKLAKNSLKHPKEKKVKKLTPLLIEPRGKPVTQFVL